MGFWAAVFIVVIQGIYFLVLIYNFVTEGFANPTSPPVQLAGGISTFLSVPTLVILFSAIRYVNPGEKEILGSLGVSFIILFAAAVGINRYVQLTLIQHSLPDVPADLRRFLSYDEGSIMFALEILGWGFFSSLAAVSVAPLFSSTSLNKSIRWLFVLYAAFSFTSIIGFIGNIPIASVAFIAWGPILLLLSILLSIYFRNPTRQGI